MKKMVLMVIFGLLVYGQAFAQSEPIMGYDTLKWGSSVLDVRKAYNLGNRYVLQENYNKDPNVAILIQNNVSDSIRERHFLFNKWKGDYQLYRVWVYYRDARTVQNLQTGLTNRFGERTNYKKDEEGYLDSSDESFTSTFGKYSPELVVELIYTESYYLNIPDQLEVCYTWKKFRDEYQARNVQF
jgi:hypothetical protein